MDPNSITYFAETDARNKKIKFGVKAKDRLKHVYVIGKTGMGKSTLLENMAIQDIQNGNGIAFIDPHGGTAEKLLDYVPENRVKDVLYFAPFDLDYPVSFNVMEDIGVDKRHLVVNGLMSTFEKIWVDAWSARMAYILNNTLLALLEYPGATLLGVNRVLSDKTYRNKVVANVTDPSVRSFWIDEFAKYTERFAAEATPAIQNKVGQFTSNPLVRNIIGQPGSSFNIRQFMDEKKIIIINLSKGRVGEGNANLIGSMLITKIYLAAMSRADSTEAELAKLPNFYLYVDEFQSFANKSFADILSEARKYKLNLTIAHQYIEQMEEEVRDAVFGNVGTMVSFRVGAFDSEVLEKEFAPTFEAADLVNLGFAQIYLKLMIDGVSSQPFSATTMGPIPRPEISFKEAVIENSRAQFARPRAEVEKGIVDWHDAGTEREVKPKVENHPEMLERKEIDNRRAPISFQEVPKNNQTKEAFMKVAEELRQKETASPTQTPVESQNQQVSEKIETPQEQRNDLKQERNSHNFSDNRRENGQDRRVDPRSDQRSERRQDDRRDMKQENRQERQNPPQDRNFQKEVSESSAKKIPSKENISSLRDALSSVMAQAVQTNKPISSPSEKEKETEKIQPQDKVGEKVQHKIESHPEDKLHTEEKKEEKPKSEQKIEEKKDKEYHAHKREVPEEVLRDLLKMDDTK